MTSSIRPVLEEPEDVSVREEEEHRDPQGGYLRGPRRHRSSTSSRIPESALDRSRPLIFVSCGVSRASSVVTVGLHLAWGLRS